MAINQLAAALVLTVISGSVLADVPSSSVVPSFSSVASSISAAPKTRAQVLAELQQARANGELNVGDADYPGARKFVSTKTRAQVLAELEQARANGTLDVADATYPGPVNVVSTKTRTQVIAELKAFEQAHGMQTLYRDY